MPQRNTNVVASMMLSTLPHLCMGVFMKPDLCFSCQCTEIYNFKSWHQKFWRALKSKLFASKHLQATVKNR